MQKETSGRALLAEVKKQIREIDPSEINRDKFAVVDVRESEELDSGGVPGSVHIPRSYLETRIENVVADRSKPIVLYCASGVRSAFGARTLMEDMGYEDVRSMTGGFVLWKDRGYEVEVAHVLSADDRVRYSRHLLVPEIGADGQKRLLNSKVLLLGAGGLGSPVALYLAAAGVGTIGIVDNDTVDLSNLQRQVIHTTENVGLAKTESAKEAIKALNPGVEVIAHQTRLNADNILDIISGYDIIVDGADNFPTRYLLNDASVRLDIPVVSASILGFDGQLSVFAPHDGPCYRCLFHEPPPAAMAPSCGANGVLGVLPGTMGLLQATEVIKLIVGVGEPLIGRLLIYDALSADFSEVKVRRDPDCPICSIDPEDIDELGLFPDYEAFCAAAG